MEQTPSKKYLKSFQFYSPITILSLSLCRGIDPHNSSCSTHSLEGGAITSFVAQGNPRVSPCKPVRGKIFPSTGFVLSNRWTNRNYPRYLIIINGIDETQAGAASTNPRLKRGKVTRWNARFRNETSSQEVSMR